METRTRTRTRVYVNVALVSVYTVYCTVVVECAVCMVTHATKRLSIYLPNINCFYSYFAVKLCEEFAVM